MSIFRKKQKQTLWLQETSLTTTALDLATPEKGVRRIEVPFTVDEIEQILLEAAERRREGGAA